MGKKKVDEKNLHDQPNEREKDVGEAEETTITLLEGQLEELEKQNEECADSLLRLRADYDNFRKRTRQELGQARDEGKAEAIKLALPVMDNLERAIAVASEEESELVKGVKMCYEQFFTSFEKEGLTRIEAEGKEFDPELHDAVMQEDTDDEKLSGTVSEVIQNGYLFEDKVLRYAVVKVYR